MQIKYKAELACHSSTTPNECVSSHPHQQSTVTKRLFGVVLGVLIDQV